MIFFLAARRVSKDNQTDADMWQTSARLLHRLGTKHIAVAERTVGILSRQLVTTSQTETSTVQQRAITCNNHRLLSVQTDSNILTFSRAICSSQFCLQKQSPPDSEKVTADTTEAGSVSDQTAEPPTQRLGLFKRFHQAYKEHGKVLIGVHCATSAVWISVFYYAAVSGVDLVPLLQKIGAADKIIQIAQSSVGNLATAYLMYKIATPARYTVTLVGTYSTVKYLRKLGYIEVTPKGESIRDLMKDGRVQMKERYGDLKDDMKDKLEEKKKKIQSRNS